MAIKVLHLFEYFNLGGIERLMDQLVRNTPKSKVEMQFFTYETEELQGIGKELAEEGYKVHTIKKQGGHDPRVWKKLIELQKREKFDVIHTHDFGPIQYGLCIKARFPQLKLFHTQHTIVHFLRHPRYVAFAQVASWFYEKMIMVSRHNRDSILSQSPLCLKEKLEVIYNGVNLEKFRPQKVTQPDDQKLVLGSVSRISPEKNIEFTIKGLGHLKAMGVPFEFHHLGAGYPQYLELLQDLATKLNIEKEVTFHGVTNEVPEHLNNWDIFISSSFTEGHPVSVIEAMAMELPCICSAIGPHLEIGDPLKFFALDDPRSLAQVIKSYHGKKDELRKMGKVARKMAQEKFSIEVMIQNYFDQYQESLQDNFSSKIFSLFGYKSLPMRNS